MRGVAWHPTSGDLLTGAWDGTLLQTSIDGSAMESEVDEKCEEAAQGLQQMAVESRLEYV